VRGRALLLALVLVGGCKKQPAANAADVAFWRWFAAHQGEVAKVQKADEPVANQLAAELHKVDPRLTFELGVDPKGPHELIVSAGGVQGAFPTVKRLVGAAPAIAGWKVIAFRPRKSTDFQIDLQDGTHLGGGDLKFRVLPDGEPGLVDVAIYVKGMRGAGEESTRQSVYLLLDAALGEYDVETRLGQIEILPGSSAPADARPFAELPAAVDARK
jgi:hypothetical protein